MTAGLGDDDGPDPGQAGEFFAAGLAAGWVARAAPPGGDYGLGEPVGRNKWSS